MKTTVSLLLLLGITNVHAINMRHTKYKIAGNFDADAVSVPESASSRILQDIPDVAINAHDVGLRREKSTSKNDVSIELPEGNVAFEVTPAIVDDGVAADSSRNVGIRGGTLLAPKHEDEDDRLIDGSLSGSRMTGEGTRRLNIFDETSLLELAADVGTCGGGNVGNGICLTEGECCSQHGWCGITAEHCGGSIFGTCGDGKVGNGVCSIQGQCCSQHGWCGVTVEHCDGPKTCGSGSVGNGICPVQGQCCSQFGWCGVTVEHCGGVSGTTKPTTRKPTSSKPSSKPVSPPTNPPTNAPSLPTTQITPKPVTLKPVIAPVTLKPTGGTCGGGIIGNGACPIQGQCCSQHGWCGVTAEFCDGPTGGTCGGGNVGNKICPIQGECCSQFGWCGVTAEHCDGVNGTPKPISSKPTTHTPTSSKPTSKPMSPPTMPPTSRPSSIPTRLPTTPKPTTLHPVSPPTPTTRPTTRKPTTRKPSTRRPSTRKPTAAPTDFPSSSPSTAPSDEPSTVPSQTPTETPLFFDGIENAGSINAGKINIMWDLPSFAGEVPDLETIHYHVFSTVGSYNVKSARENFTIEELISHFESEGADNNMFQHHLVAGDAFEFSVNTAFLGELHTIFVIAEADGVFSTNSDATEIYASSSDPIMKDGVNIVGMFVPTQNLNITITAIGDMSNHPTSSPTAKPTTRKPTSKPTTRPTTPKPTALQPASPQTPTGRPTTNKPTTRKPTTRRPSTRKPTTSTPTSQPTIPRPKFILEFEGLLRSEHQNLKAGDFVSGIMADARLFFYQINSVISSSDQKVVLDVMEGRLEDIYDSVEFEASAGISRPEKVPLNLSSMQRHRHLISRMNSRRLFLDFVGNWFNDQVIKPVGNWIGDRISDVSEAVMGLVELVKSGEVEKSFELVNIDESIEFPLSDNGTIFGNSTEVTFAELKSRLTVRADLFVNVKVSFDELSAEAGFRIDYSLGFELTLDLVIEKTVENTREGKKMHRDFMIGPVPVWVTAQPSLKSKLSVKAEAKSGLTLKGGVKGGGHISVSASVSNGITGTFKPPGLEPYFDYEISDVELNVTGSYIMEPIFTVELYGGLLKGDVSFPAGPSIDIAARGVDINGNSRIALEKFDISAGVSGGVSIGTNLRDDPLHEQELFKKKILIISLPKARFPSNALHYCEEDPGGAKSAGIDIIIVVQDDDDSLFKNGFRGDAEWFISDGSDWSLLAQEEPFKAKLSNTGVSLSSSSVSGNLNVAIRPKFPPLPFPVVYSVELESIVKDTTVDCIRNGPCSEGFFEGMTQEFGDIFNSQVFLSQDPDPNNPPSPSKVYKFEDLMTALEVLKGKENFRMWLGDGCDVDSKKRALVNIAAFLGQAMVETIKYDACDENNWDKWRADVFKEPSSPPEYLSAFYPMSSSCGQLGQSYEDYDCPDACPKDPSMDITATTNAAWIGAPPPLFCGPTEKYNNLGYWNPMKFCEGPDKSCDGQPFNYPGQTAGYHFSTDADPKYPNEYYANPLPDADGNTQPARFENLPRTNVEGCCWWGRGVIQTTGRCNFGKLNKNLGAGAQDGLYPDINFCSNPQALCDGPSELKWIAGIFFWVSEVESYEELFGLINYKQWVHTFVDMGCADDPDMEGCDFLFEYSSGIVNRGCADPGETGCPGCIPGATCDPAHNVPERVEASKHVLRAFLSRL